MSIPEFHDLSYYANPEAHSKRYLELSSSFHKIYNEVPEFISRSPGRVNLIGEHIDYVYFSVLPLAIDVDVIMAVSSNNSSKIVLNNVDSSKFREAQIEIPSNNELISIDQTVSDWSNYFKCGLLVAHQFIKEKDPSFKGLKGLNILVHGTVPTGGGLSSSAAFIVASTLAILQSNGVKISKQDLTKITVVSEHYVGVNTGGMDQCASICGEKNHALYVQFKPTLSAKPFPFPQTNPELIFIIANTLITSNKHETAPTNYNLRVVEVSICAEILAKHYNLKLTQDSNLLTGTLRGFMETYYTQVEKSTEWDGDINEGIKRLTKMLSIVEEVFTKQEGYSTEEAANELGASVEELKARFFKYTVRYENFQLYKRAKHAYSEALRVLKSLELLQSNPKESSVFFKEFGSLMNQSQASCDEYYNCSCSEINKVCEIALANGSFGSRLTGAGWGGSTVHLTTTDKAENLKTALINDYYKIQFPGITEEELNEAIVVSAPAVGSSLYFGNGSQ